MLLGVTVPFWLVGGALAGALIGLALYTGAGVIHAGRRRLARQATEVRATDQRAPVLYLRSFKDDGLTPRMSMLRGRSKLSYAGLFRGTYEQKLAHALSNLGPFIAVGNPSEERPPLGAARLYANDATWKSTVAKMLGKAQLVVLHAGESDGLLWELAEIRKTVDPLKVLIALPMDVKNGEAVEKARYEKFCERARSIFPHALPESVAGAQFLYFDRDWRSFLLVPVRGEAPSPGRPDESSTGATQVRALNGLHREFLRVSSPYWIRMVVALFLWMAGVLGAIYLFGLLFGPRGWL